MISLSGIKTPFLLSSAVSFTLALLTTVAIKELLKIKRNSREETLNPRKSGSSSIATAIVSVILFSFIGGITYNLFPAHATSLSIPAYEIGIIMFTNGLFRLAAFIEAYKIEAKIGKISTLLVGSLTLAFASALTTISSTALFFALAFSIFGFGMGILYAVSIALILKNGSSAKGHAAGIFESLIGVGNFLGSSIGGIASEYFAPNAPYLLGLLISLSAGFYLWLHLLKNERQNGVFSYLKHMDDMPIILTRI